MDLRRGSQAGPSSTPAVLAPVTHPQVTAQSIAVHPDFQVFHTFNPKTLQHNRSRRNLSLSIRANQNVCDALEAAAAFTIQARVKEAWESAMGGALGSPRMGGSYVRV